MGDYDDGQIERAVDYLFKQLSPIKLTREEWELAAWINDRMLSGDITAGTVKEIRQAMKRG